MTATYLSYVEWSKDGRTWNHTDNTSDEVIIPVSVASGEKVYWRGSGKRMSYSGNNGYTSGFSTTGKFAISGHLASILKGSDFEDIDFSGAAFARLFQDCSNLTSAEELILPSFTVASVFSSMFLRCTALVSAPELPPVTNLTTGCYYQMFFGCSSLTHVKCLATDISATNCLQNWLNGVSSTGTFIQAAGVTWPRGASGIPTGWLAYDEGEQIPNDYTPCDYIYNSSQSGGGVDLGFKFRILDYSAEAKFKQDEISNGMVIGTYTNNSGAIWFYNYSVAGSFRINACYSSGWKYNVNGFMPLETDTHIIRYVGDADGCYQLNDGTKSGIHDISTWAVEESTDRLFIFGRSQSQNTYKGRIYYLKVWNTATEEVICNLIPCSRNSDGAAGFWDTAQKKFFTSTYWTAHNDNE